MTASCWVCIGEQASCFELGQTLVSHQTNLEATESPIPGTLSVNDTDKHFHGDARAKVEW